MVNGLCSEPRVAPSQNLLFVTRLDVAGRRVGAVPRLCIIFDLQMRKITENLRQIFRKAFG
jgi:hypothetical protein